MQSNFADDSSLDVSGVSSDIEKLMQEKNISPDPTTSGSADEQTEFPPEQVPFAFETHFRGFMAMYSDPDTVATYLDAHEGWFCRCAQPMTAEPFGENGYVLTVGHFGAFGYEVEPKMAVVLDPPKDGLYDMYSVEIPDYTPPGYEVDYHASMTLAGVDASGVSWMDQPDLTDVITQVEWQLHLQVTIQFPQFIYKLPRKLLQKTGDRLLSQIVKQISPRLTYKVQKDFHDRFQLPLPPKTSRGLVSLKQSEDPETET